MRRSLALEDLSETQFDALLFGAQKGTAPTLGWDSFHALKMRGSKPGYPDRTAWRDRTLFAELKVGKNKPSPEQLNILDGLARAGAEVYLWRPEDFEEIGLVLARRWDFRPFVAGARPCPYFAHSRGKWTPRAAWIPGVGRADTLPDYAAGSP